MLKSTNDMFRALAAFPQDDYARTGKLQKEEWCEAQKEPLDDFMSHFLTTNDVTRPYPTSLDADKLYGFLHNGRFPKDMSGVADELSKAYGKDGLSFFTEKPRTARKTDKSKPAKKTGLYVYSHANPIGYFSDWLYPIHHSYGGVDAQAAKLVHHGYGTMYDVIQVGDCDWRACFLPDVVFVAWDEQTAKGKQKPREYDIIERVHEDVLTDEDWADFVKETLLKRIGRHGVVAVVECKL